MPSAKKKIRDIERLLQKSTLDEALRLTLTAELEKYKSMNQLAVDKLKEKEFAVKYHKIKFFERRKLTRKINSIEAQLSRVEDQSQRTQLTNSKDLSLKDLAYVMYYPKNMKYISLFIKGDDEESDKSIKLKESARQLALQAWEADKAEGKDLVLHAMQASKGGEGKKGEVRMEGEEGEEEGTSTSKNNKKRNQIKGESEGEMGSVDSEKKEMKESKKKRKSTNESEENTSSSTPTSAEEEGSKELEQQNNMNDNNNHNNIDKKKQKKEKHQKNEKNVVEGRVVIGGGVGGGGESVAADPTFVDPFFVEEVRLTKYHPLPFEELERKKQEEAGFGKNGGGDGKKKWEKGGRREGNGERKFGGTWKGKQPPPTSQTPGSIKQKDRMNKWKMRQAEKNTTFY